MTLNHILTSVVVMAVTLALTGCDAKPSRKTSESAKQIAWMEKGKESVKSKLKDPESAEFRGVFFNRGGSKNTPMTCGEVNSKNSLGGYSGFQRFVSAGKPELTFLEEQMKGFTAIWDKFCK